MIALFLIGTITDIGHHYYYQSLDGKEVISDNKSQWSVDVVRNSQGWKIRQLTFVDYCQKYR